MVLMMHDWFANSRAISAVLGVAVIFGTAGCPDPTKHVDDTGNRPNPPPTNFSPPGANGAGTIPADTPDLSGATGRAVDQSRATIADLGTFATQVAVTPDGTAAIVGGSDGKLRLVALDLRHTGEATIVHTIDADAGPITALTITGNGKLAIAGTRTGNIIAVALHALAPNAAATAVVAHRMSLGAERITTVAVTASPEPAAFVATAGGGLWRISVPVVAAAEVTTEAALASGIGKPTEIVSPTGIGAIAFLPEKADATHQWALIGHTLGQISLQPLPVRSTAPNPDSTPAAPPLEWTSRPHENVVDCAVVTLDGGWAITGDRAGATILWRIDRDFPSMRSVGRLGGMLGVHALAVSSDNEWALIAGDAPTVELWRLDLRSGGQAWYVADLVGHRAAVLSTTFSPDGRWALTASRDGTTKLWRLPIP